jgi:hypothetical protein
MLSFELTTKCQYHLIEWAFTMSGAPILQTHPFNKPIELLSPVGQTLPIKQLRMGTSYKTLGAFIKPMQHQKTQYGSLLKKSRKHTKLLATSSCKRQHTWIYYFSVYLPSVGYALPICHLSKNELKTIQQPMTPVLLTKMGICQSTSRLLCFLSSYYGGLDLRDLYIEQGSGQILFIIGHLRGTGMTRRLLQIVLSCGSNIMLESPTV